MGVLLASWSRTILLSVDEEILKFCMLAFLSFVNTWRFESNEKKPMYYNNLIVEVGCLTQFRVTFKFQNFLLEFLGSLEWRFWLVCTGTWSIGVDHIYHGIKLVARNYFQCRKQGYSPGYKMLAFWSRDLFLGTTIRMPLLLAVSFLCLLPHSGCEIFVASNLGALLLINCSFFFVIYFYFLGKILLLGGTGKDGKRRLIGWPSRESICLWHLQGKRLFGRKFSRWFSVLPLYSPC